MGRLRQGAVNYSAQGQATPLGQWRDLNISSLLLKNWLDLEKPSVGFAEVTDTDDDRVSSGIFVQLGHCSFCFMFRPFPWKTGSFQIQLKNLRKISSRPPNSRSFSPSTLLWVCVLTVGFVEHLAFAIAMFEPYLPITVGKVKLVV